MSRIEGNPDGVALLRRYMDTRKLGAGHVRALVDESKQLWPEEVAS